MYNVTRYEAELIRAFRENLECLSGISVSESAFRKAVDALVNEFVEDMKNAE